MNNIDIITRKQLRGDIVVQLYGQFGRPLPVKSLIQTMRGTYPMAETEVPIQLYYLSDPQKGFVTITYQDDCEPELTPLRGAFVQLTAAGVNLWERDINDPGVIFGDAIRS